MENEHMSLQQGDTMISQYFNKAKSIYNEIGMLDSVRQRKEGSDEVI